MTKETYQDLMKSNVNAWALWDNDSMKFPDKDYSDIASYLKPSIIILGLNPSKTLDTFRNFHSTNAGDKRLKEAIQGDGKDFDKPSLKNISGAFMTDLVHEKIESNSRLVEIEAGVFSDFEDILDTLNQKEYTIICLGGKVYEAAKSWLLNEKEVDDGLFVCDSSRSQKWTIRLYKVMHPSYRYGENAIGKQLLKLNTVL